MVVIVPRPGHDVALGAKSDQRLVLQGGGVGEVLPRFIFDGCVVWVYGSFGEKEVDGAEGG